MGAQRRLKPLRVVLDTNVLVSALLFSHGTLAWVRVAWQDGLLVPLLSRATAEELLRVLNYPKFRLSAAARDELLADILPYCESIEKPVSGVPPCRDVYDRMFLELAVAGRAAGLVTGDADLLELAGNFEIPIITPVELRERLRDTA